MLSTLTIQNYALIDQLSIDFSSGLSIITGETGAGKSILLGALGLVLGNRADSTTLKDGTKKCVVEAHLQIKAYGLEDFFEEADLDYDENTIIRREILPSGKSRAFVNDTPVTLNILNNLKVQLVDIHSQHQTLQLSDVDFQFELLDALAGNMDKLKSYKRGLQQYNVAKRKLETLIQEQREAHQQYDYNVHLYNELVDADLKEDEQEGLEEQLEKINNVEEIKSNLAEALQISFDEQVGLQTSLHHLESKLSRISAYAKDYEELFSRISSLKIELNDIIAEIENANEHIDFDPRQAEQLNERLQLIYTLQKKHYVGSIEELLTIQEELSEKVSVVENAEHLIEEQRHNLNQIAEKLDVLAHKISDQRKKSIPILTVKLQSILADLGMTQARFSVHIDLTDSYFKNGKDELSFLFAANKGGQFGELKKVASGGELSRIMLAIKKVLSEDKRLPTIIFDEIDTGVSGEISNKIAHIMQQMSQKMQVITITHLPQIAAKGSHHYKVFKEEKDGVTVSSLKRLTADERIVEIAEMLSGKDISDSALTHAKELLN